MNHFISKYTGSVVWLVAAGALVAGCSGGDPAARGGDGESVGTLQAKVVSASPHDVTQVFYRVVAADQDCNGAALAERISPLEAEDLPASLQTPGSSGEHHFSDALFTLDPGQYRLCAIPQNAEGGVSAACGATEMIATVSPGVTTEVVLISQCNGNQRGGLDGVVVLNDAPVIDDLSIQPSKFIGTCEEATLTATISDPEGDAISAVAWQLLTPGATLTGNGSSATFSATHAGDYQVQVLATDANGGVGSLIVPVHVTGEDCGGCQGTRPNVLLCGSSSRPISDFVPPGLNIIQSCAPDSNTQAMVVTRDGVLDPDATRAYVEAGGIVLTEWSGSANVYNAVFDEEVTLGEWRGNCQDNVNTVVRFNESDPFWMVNGSLPVAADEGCGYDMSAYPGITPLGGWAGGGVELAYRDAGAGRVWLIEADWQDNESYHQNDPVLNQLMGYMVQNGGSGGSCNVPAVCSAGNDSTTMSPWVVCAADGDTAWVSANNAGYYHVDEICQQLGYARMSQQGGTCGNVCGYCEGNTSCDAPGQRIFDGNGDCGVDEHGRITCYTVMWECTNTPGGT